MNETELQETQEESEEQKEESNEMRYQEPDEKRAKRQTRNKRKYYLRKALRAAGNKRQRRIAKVRFRKD